MNNQPISLQPKHRARQPLIAARFLLLVLIGACTQSDSEPPSPTPTDHATTTPTPTPTQLPTLPLAASVQFTDVSAAAGLNQLHIDISTVTEFPCNGVEMMSGGVAAGDYDNDGWIDLFLTRPLAADLLYHNLGNGTFAEVGAVAGVAWPGSSNGAAWGDFDSDGNLDLYVVTIGEETHRLYLNNGDGTFREEALLRGAAGVNQQPGNCTNNWSVSVHDYDRDGDLDLHTTQWQRSGVASALHARLLRNDGLGFFSDATLDSGLDLTASASFTSIFADVNDDGWADALIAADWQTSRLFHNMGDGRFADRTESAGIGSEENGMGAAVGDIDGDGDLDWFVSAIYDPTIPCPGNWGCSGNRLYLNRGDGTFIDSTDAWGVRNGGWGWGAAMVDYDNDGDLDLAHVNGFQGPLASLFTEDPSRFWRNDRSGLMPEIAADSGFADRRQGRALVPFDMDNDGDLDFVVTNAFDTPLVLRNDGGNEQSWLRVRLRGRQSNKHGIGAKLLLITNPEQRNQRRDMSGSSTFLGQAPIEVHFGLGRQRQPAHELRIYWPGHQQVQIVRDIALNQILVLDEPER